MFANNAQSQGGPARRQGGVGPGGDDGDNSEDGKVYDLFNGGEVPVKDGKATLRLAAGDGACWVHFPNRMSFNGAAKKLAPDVFRWTT